MVQQLPEGDQTSFTKRQMLARMDVCMGGRVAEELVYGADEVTSGASSDIVQATRLARNMVTKWGFSDEVGVVYHSGKVGADHSPSPETQAAIDLEVKRLCEASYARATKILTDHRDELDLVAHALIARETLSGAELKEVIGMGVEKSKPKPPLVPEVSIKPPRLKPAATAGAAAA